MYFFPLLLCRIVHVWELLCWSGTINAIKFDGGIECTGRKGEVI